MTTNISINDLPVELLLMLAPHLNANTINNLRCVNKYFNKIFKDDIFWERYLYFDEKYFLCDLRSDSESPALQEEFDEDSKKKIGKWLCYYKLQRAHIENWVSGRNQNSFTISLSPNSVSYMEETVNKDYEHWLFFCLDNSICVCNITKTPQPLKSFSIGPYGKMRLLPHGKLLVRDFSFDESDGLIAVYKFENNSLNLNLSFKFVYYMDAILDEGMKPTKTFLFNFRYIVAKDLFIGYNCTSTTWREFYLHVWDLNAGIKLEKINLDEYEAVRVFVDFVHFHTPNRIDIARNSIGCLLNLYEGEYPNVIIVLKYCPARISQVSIFNLKSMQFTYLVDQLQSDVLHCSMYSDKVCLEELTLSVNEAVWRASIYDVNSGPKCWRRAQSEEQSSVVLKGKRLRYITSSVVSVVQGVSLQSPNSSIVLKKSKVFVKTENEVHVISLDTDPIHHIQIGVTASYSILGFIEPKLLLMYDLHQNPTSTTVKVYNALSGVELCSWDGVNTSRDRFSHYFRNLEYPSKLVLSLENTPDFKVFYF